MNKQLDRFTLLEALGPSGTGSVYKAQENLPGGAQRLVALKVHPPVAAGDKAAEARYYAEVRAIAPLTGHPNVVTYYSMGIIDRTPWLAMEYVAGNLGQFITEQPAQPADVAKMLDHVGRALAYLHGLTPPILHNDLKPSNILIDRFGTFKLTNFALAGLATADTTHGIDTVRYSAPEVLSREFGQIGTATDIYALGHIAYEYALGGRQYRQQFPAVFDERDSSREANPAKWMAWHCSMTTHAAPLNEVRKDFPQGLSEIIAKMMLKALSARYATVTEILTELQQTQATGSIPTATTIPAAPIALKPTATSPHPGMKPPVMATPAAPAPSTGPQYWVRLRGRQSGPYDLATLQRQARQGQLSRLHQVSNDQVNWRPAAGLEGVFGNPG